MLCVVMMTGRILKPNLLLSRRLCNISPAARHWVLRMIMVGGLVNTVHGCSIMGTTCFITSFALISSCPTFKAIFTKRICQANSSIFTKGICQKQILEANSLHSKNPTTASDPYNEISARWYARCGLFSGTVTRMSHIFGESIFILETCPKFLQKLVFVSQKGFFHNMSP